jgi:hypothetical protein
MDNTDISNQELSLIQNYSDTSPFVSAPDAYQDTDNATPQYTGVT